MTRRLLAWAVCVVAGACHASVPFSDDSPVRQDAAALPGEDASETADGGGSPVAESDAPSIEIVSPADASTIAGGTFVVQGTANDTSGVASVFVSIGGNSPLLASTSDGFKTWHVDGVAPLGSFDVRAVAYDLFGNIGADEVTVMRPAGGTDTTPPTVAITSPATGSSPSHLTVVVEGTASDDVGVTTLRVTLDGVLLTGQVVATDDFFATWATQLTLSPGVTNTIRIDACDAAGNCATTTVQVEGRPQVDHEAPIVSIATPAAGATVDASSVAVTGSARDNLGIREVKVRARAAAGDWGGYVPAVRTPQPDGSEQWTTPLAIPAGAVTIEARAIDVSGLATTASVDVTNTYAAPYGDEVVIPLRVYTVTTPPQLRANLDKAGVKAIIDATTQKNTLLLAVDPTTLLTNSLTAIRDACNYETSSASCTAGTAKVPDWKKDLRSPDYNCSCTPLGQSFAGGEASPEFRLVRLLTMTPANVEVQGTSVQELAQLANDWGLGGGFNQIVADMLGITRTSTVLNIPDVLTPVLTRFMASHPYLDPARNTFVTSGTWTPFSPGHIPVTLYDAMNDLAPLGGALGPNSPGMPASAHPGVLDPSLAPFSRVLLDAFSMLLVADSNLRWFDGVELDRGKDYMALVVDTNGGNDVLEFDFNDPAKFDLTGLASSPTVDLRLKIYENDAKVPACTSNNGTCKANTPSQPFGTSFVWSKPMWELENIVTFAAFGRYKGRTYYRCYLTFFVCVADITISNPSVNRDGITGGWTDVYTAFGFGNPPPDQYLWELLSEIAQVAMHRVGNQLGAIAEGSADPAFTLQDVPLGITADQIKAAVRPTLQAQKATLSQSLLGDYKQNNGDVDFYLKRGADSALYLFFTHATDPTPAPYANAKPGFFDDEALTSKVSSTAAGTSGDTVHEKWKLQAAGAPDVTLYAQDPAGTVYRIKVHVPVTAGADIELRVARKM